MSPVLRCDPDELEVTARSLRQAVAELEAVAGEVRAAGDPVWSGLAALEQAARRAEMAELVGRLAPPLQQVAGALDQVAAAAREQAGTVRRHTRLCEELSLERSRLIALGPPPEPLAAAHWTERLSSLEEERFRHQLLVEDAEREFGAVQRRVALLIEGIRAHVPQVVWDLALTFATVQKVAGGARQVAAAGSLADTARRLRRMPVPGGERTLHLMRERVDKQVSRLRMRAPGWVSRVPGGAAVAGRAVPAVALVDAARGVVTGGGYDGWRGGATRVLGAVGVVGAGVAVVTGGLAVGASAPVLGVAGLGAAAVYQAWVTGNWVYDNRDRIAGTASRAWSGARGLVTRASSAGRSVVGRARERATAGLDRLRQRLRPAVDGSPAPAGAQP